VNHARRQERYRERRRREKEKVTHQGSPPEPLVADGSPSLPSGARVSAQEAALEVAEAPPRAEVNAPRKEPPRSRSEALGDEVKEIHVPPPSNGNPTSRSRDASYRCHFCGRALGTFTRLDFLRERRRRP
jgi:hypothetical protein